MRQTEHAQNRSRFGIGIDSDRNRTRIDSHLVNLCDLWNVFYRLHLDLLVESHRLVRFLCKICANTGFNRQTRTIFRTSNDNTRNLPSSLNSFHGNSRTFRFDGEIGRDEVGREQTLAPRRDTLPPVHVSANQTKLFSTQFHGLSCLSHSQILSPHQSNQSHPSTSNHTSPHSQFSHNHPHPLQSCTPSQHTIATPQVPSQRPSECARAHTHTHTPHTHRESSLPPCSLTIHTRIHMHTHARTHACTHAHTHAHTHTCTHTQSPPYLRARSLSTHAYRHTHARTESKAHSRVIDDTDDISRLERQFIVLCGLKVVQSAHLQRSNGCSVKANHNSKSFAKPSAATTHPLSQSAKKD